MAVSICSPDFMTVSIETIPFSRRYTPDRQSDRVKEVPERHLDLFEIRSQPSKVVSAPKFIPPNTYFDPDTLEVLGAAFDRTIDALRDGRRQPETVREVIADHIVVLASNGERDPDRLCKVGLTSMGVPSAWCPTIDANRRNTVGE